MKSKEALINLYFVTVAVVTVKEYESLVKELQAHALVGDITLGDRILAQLLDGCWSRYYEAKEQNEENERMSAL